MRPGRFLNFTRLFSTASALLLASIIFLIVPGAADAADPGAPRARQDAYTKIDRQDLAERIQQSGDIRVIVGLQTPQEFAQGVDRAPDQVKAQAVS